MPHRHAAVKKLRQDKKRRQQNLKAKMTIKKTLKKFHDTLKEKPAEAKPILKQLFSLLDKAIKKGLFHKNNASRQKSRLNKQLNKAQKGAKP